LTTNAIFLIIAAGVALFSVVLLVSLRRAQNNPVAVAKGEIHQQALAAVKAQGDGDEALRRYIKLRYLMAHGEISESEDAAISARLKQLDDEHERGEITDAIYIERYRGILNALVQGT
jgi:hypothetical protein